MCRASPPDPDLCGGVRSLPPAYAYLLGLYLGDGMLSLGRRGVWRLRITLDVRYPEIIRRASAAIEAISRHRAGATSRPGCVEVNGYWKHWVCMIPQHGLGPKHLRAIRLTSWQRMLVERYPDEFLAGLIHSDGCRCLNRVKGRAYPRYFFTNLSPDIRELFITACGMVGVESRVDGPRNVSVARRESVAIMDDLIGPKR